MEAKNIKVALPTMIGLMTGLIPVIGLYFTTETSIHVIQVKDEARDEKIRNMELELKDLKRNDVELLKAFNDMKLEVIEEIHELKVK